MGSLAVTGDAAADRLLNENPLALMVGMLLDQQIPIEWAFASPAKLEQRLGEPLTAEAVVRRSVDEVSEIFGQKPALHRFPASMAKRTPALCDYLIDHHEGDAAAVWTEVDDAAELRRHLLALPGFGPYAAGQAMRLLGRYEDLALDSWVRKEVAGLLGGRVSDAKIADAYAPFDEFAGLALWMDVTARWHALS